jgi:hypothetical protein
MVRSAAVRLEKWGSIPSGVRDFSLRQCVQTDPGANRASSSVDTKADIPWDKVIKGCHNISSPANTKGKQRPQLYLQSLVLHFGEALN